MPRKKSSAVKTEVIGLDGVKTVIESETKSKSTTKKTKKSTSTKSSKKTTVKKPFKQNEIDVEKIPERDLELKPRKESDITEDVKKVDATNDKVSTDKDDTKSISYIDKLVDQIADLLIKKLSNVFIRVEDAQKLVISTIQKLAIGELRADASESTE